MNIAKNLRDKSLLYDWRTWLVLPISRELDIPLNKSRSLRARALPNL